MIQIPSHIQTRYKSLLIEKTVHEKNHHLYLKWLRYYPDFCLKYKFNKSDRESLAEFLDKLQEKNQTSQQQKQASDAISIYYETGTQQSGKYFSGSNQKYFISERQKESTPESANWKPVYDALTAEIKLRHYSPKTLKAYTG